MGFVASTTSTGSGFWTNAGIWSAGVPDIDDQVTIASGHTVTISSTPASFADLYVDGGILAIEAGGTITVKDAAGTHATGEHIRISNDTTSGWNSNGTAASPVIVQSQNTGGPTNRIKWLFEDIAGTEARTFDFTYQELRDTAYFLGNDTRYVWFNTGDVTNDGIMDAPIPINREPKLVVHNIEDGSYDNVYSEGTHAGSLDLSGLIPWAVFDWQTMQDMKDNEDKVAFQSEYITMPSARIESLRFGRRAGLYLPFNLTLIEVLN